jgi:hypothetical protein
VLSSIGVFFGASNLVLGAITVLATASCGRTGRPSPANVTGCALLVPEVAAGVLTRSGVAADEEAVCRSATLATRVLIFVVVGTVIYAIVVTRRLDRRTVEHVPETATPTRCRRAGAVRTTRRRRRTRRGLTDAGAAEPRQPQLRWTLRLHGGLHVR